MVKIEDFNNLSFFEKFSTQQLERLSDIGEMTSFEKNDFVYRPEDSSDHLFIVNRGSVSLIALDDDNNVGIDFGTCKEGDLFGASCIGKACGIDEPRYTLSAICTEKTEVFSFPTGKLIQFCEEDFSFGYLLLSSINQVYFKRYGLAKRALRDMIKASNMVTKYVVA
jgi:CRP-like cAMP-binding protein